MSKITYTDKVAVNATVNAINECTADDLNEIKTVINDNDDRLIIVENGEAGQSFADQTAATAFYNAATPKPDNGLIIYLIAEKEFHKWDSANSPNFTTFVRDEVGELVRKIRDRAIILQWLGTIGSISQSYDSGSGNLTVSWDETFIIAYNNYRFSTKTAGNVVLPAAYDFAYIDINLINNTAGAITVGSWDASFSPNWENPTKNEIRVILFARNGDNSLGYSAFNEQEYIKEKIDLNIDAILVNSLEIDEIKSNVYVSQTIGEAPITTVNASSSICYVDYSLFTKSGVLQNVRINLTGAGDFKLVHFRKTASTTWDEIANYDYTGVAGQQTIDVTGDAITVQENDTFGIFPVTANPRYNASTANSNFINAGSTPGSFTFTDSVFPVATGTGIAMDFEFTVLGQTANERLDALELESIQKQDAFEKHINQEDGIWGSNTQVTVKKDGSGDYLTLQAAIDGISADLVNSDIREILVYNDFEALDDSDYPSYNIGSSHNAIIKMLSNVKLRGVGGIKKLFATMPTNKANPLYYDYTQAIYFLGGGIIENMHIVARNIRYPIHSDNIGTADTTTKIINCIIEHEGCDDVPDTPAGNRWHQPSAWGGGTRSGQLIDFIGTDFISPIYPFSNHSNIDFTNPNKISFDDCKFINTKHGYSLNIEIYGSNQQETYEIKNCFLSGSIRYLANWFTAVNKEDARTLTPKIIGRGNTPVLYDNILTPATSSGQVLKITSDSTGSSSTVIVTGGTAKDLIFGTEYAKNGGGGLSGYSHGTREVRYGTAGATATQYSHTLGHRLGDCTSVNKTLIVEVDGVEKTITFNLDYAGGVDTSIAPTIDNTTILTSMTASLGTATASTFSLPAEYYPEWTDAVEIRANESTTDEILIGMGCMAVGTSFVRKAVEGEVPDFVALDNIVPSGISGVLDDRGRLLKFGYLEVTDRFQPLWDGATPTFTAGEKARIGTTAGMFIKDATGSTSMVAEYDVASANIILGFNI